jgi:hypothetical protein
MEQISFLLGNLFRDTLMLPLKTEIVTIDSQESNFSHELAYGLLPQSKKTVGSSVTPRGYDYTSITL